MTIAEISYISYIKLFEHARDYLSVRKIRFCSNCGQSYIFPTNALIHDEEICTWHKET